MITISFDYIFSDFYGVLRNFLKQFSFFFVKWVDTIKSFYRFFTSSLKISVCYTIWYGPFIVKNSFQCNATFVVLGRLLLFCRWKFMSTGPDKIMTF